MTTEKTVGQKIRDLQAEIAPTFASGDPAKVKALRDVIEALNKMTGEVRSAYDVTCDLAHGGFYGAEMTKVERIRAKSEKAAVKVKAKSDTLKDALNF